MMQPGSGRLRIARGGALAGLCLLIAATGHVGAGGALPPVAPLLAIGALIGGAFVRFADRERGLGAIMLAAVGSQLLFHTGFELAAQGGHGGPGGHGAHGGHASSGVASPDGMPGALGALLGALPGDEMFLAHMAGAAVLALLARHGESLLWGLARLFGIARIPSLCPVAPVRCTAAAPRPRTPLLEPRARAEARIRPRRGPPASGPIDIRNPCYPPIRKGFFSMYETRVRAWRRCCRVTTITAVTAVALLAAGPAYAHVTVDPSEAEQGGYATLTFRVPNESEDAGTVELTVKLPQDTPIISVRTKPKPGWSAEVDTKKLDKPVDIGTVDVAEAVTSITWTAEKGTRVDPGEFEEFKISAGPLPSTTDALEFPAIQTYDDGEVSKWNQSASEGGSEPEHPAPTVTLSEASGGHGGSASATSGGDGASDGAGNDAAEGSSADSSTTAADSTARTLGGVGIGLGAVGVLVGAGAVLAARRAPRAGAPTRTKE